MADVAKNAESKGFTGSEATKRLRERVGKVQVQFLALSIMAKMKGKTNKAIRNDLGDNCPSWISKIFTMADKVMAHIEPARQDEISRMTVAEAEKAVVARIETHMTALGTAGFEKYGKVCHFASKCDASELVLNPPKDEPEGDKADETTAEPEPEPENKAIDAPINGVDAAFNLASGLSDDELIELATRINALMASRAETAAAAPELREAA